MGVGFSHPSIRGCHLLTLLRIGPSVEECLDNQFHVGLEPEYGPSVVCHLIVPMLTTPE